MGTRCLRETKIETRASRASARALPPGPEDVDRAVADAARALKSWSLVPAPRRAELVFRGAEMLVKNKEEFARQMTQEMGKSSPKSRGCPGSHRHELLHGGRRAPTIRPDGPIGVEEQVRDIRADAWSKKKLMNAPSTPVGKISTNWSVKTAVIKPATDTPHSQNAEPDG